MPRASYDHVMNNANTTGTEQTRLIWKRKPQRHLLGISPYHSPECRMSAHQRILLSNAKYLVEEDKRSGRARTFYYPNEKVFVGLKPGQTPPPPQTQYVVTPPLSPKSQPKPLVADEAHSSNFEYDTVPAAIRIKQALEALRRKDTEPALLEDEDEEGVQQLPTDGSNEDADASTSTNFVSYSESSGFWTTTLTKVEEPRIDFNAPLDPSYSERRQEVEVNPLNGVQVEQDTQPCNPRSFGGQVNASVDYLEDVLPAADEPMTILKDESMANLDNEDLHMADETWAPTEQPAQEPQLQTQHIINIVDEFLAAAQASQALRGPALTPAPAPEISIPKPAQSPGPTIRVPLLHPIYTPSPPQPQPQPQPPQNPVVVNPLHEAYNIWARLAADVQARTQPLTSPPLKIAHQTHVQDVPLASSSESITAQPVGMQESQEASVEHLDSDPESERNFRGAVERFLLAQSSSADLSMVMPGFGCGRPMRPLPSRVGRSSKAEMKTATRSAVRGSEDDLKVRLEWERELGQEQSRKRKKRQREEDSGYESNSKADSKSTSTSTLRMPTSDADDSEDEDNKPRPVKRVRFSEPLESFHFVLTCPSRSWPSRGRDETRTRKEQKQNEKAKARIRMKARAQLQLCKMATFCLEVSNAVGGFFSSKMPSGWA